MADNVNIKIMMMVIIIILVKTLDNRAYSHDVTAAILASFKQIMWDRVALFSYVNTFFCFH